MSILFNYLEFVLSDVGMFCSEEKESIHFSLPKEKLKNSELQSLDSYQLIESNSKIIYYKMLRFL